MNRHPAACRPSVSPLIDQPTRLTRSWQVYTVKNIRISPTDILRRVLHILTERRFSIRSCPAQAQVHVAIDGYERIRNRTRRELSVNKRIFLQCTPPPHSSGMRTVDLHTHTHTHTRAPLPRCRGRRRGKFRSTRTMCRYKLRQRSRYRGRQSVSSPMPFFL